MKIKLIKLKDILSARKRRAFIIGTYYARIKPKLMRLDNWIKKLDQKDITVELTEIDKAFNIVFRYYLCEQCMINGFCSGCGCTMPDGIIPTGNSCHYKKWQGMIKEPLAYYKSQGYDLVLKTPIKKELSQEEFKKLFK